ncbi:MAG: deoxynucleoside kinase [Patescibacteria group bacterium]
MNGKLIVIDATDGCGKTTQVNRLLERLKENGHKTEMLKFPQHEKSYFGNLIDCFLNGHFGDPTTLNPYLVSALYAADRFEASKRLKEWLAEDKIVVLDRYVSANQIHQGSKIKNDTERENFLNWLEKIEHGIFELPRPDIILYLDVSPETSRRIMTERGKLDGNEENLDYQRMSREQSLRLVSKMNNWKRITCEDGGNLLPIEIIHEKIWAIVQKMV